MTGKCVKCGGIGVIEKHHYKGQRQFLYGSGMGKKVNNLLIMEVCPACHKELHENKLGKLENSELQLHLIMLTMMKNATTQGK